MAVEVASSFLLLVVCAGLLLAPPALSVQLNSPYTAEELGEIGKFLSAELSTIDEPRQYSLAVQAALVIRGTAPNRDSACRKAAQWAPSADLRGLYFVSEVQAALKCETDGSKHESVLRAALAEKASVVNVFYGVMGLHNFGLKIDSSAVLSVLDELLKKEDKPASVGLAALIASTVLKSEKVAFIADMFEDSLAQADELDQKLLMFEGGLQATSLFLRGMLALVSSHNLHPDISGEQITKLANFILDKKYSRKVDDIFYAVSAARAIADSKLFVPTAVHPTSVVHLADENNVVQVSVTDLMGAPVTSTSIRASIVCNKDFAVEETVVGGKINFGAINAPKGMCSVTLRSTNPKPYLDAEQEVSIVNTVKVTVTDVELTLSERDQTTSQKPISVSYPDKIKATLAADYHQRVTLKFRIVRAGTKESVRAHQVFIRMRNVQTAQEIFFVAEPNALDQYKFDLDVATAGKDFGNLSGKYSMGLITGHFTFSQALQWDLGDISLTFSGSPSTPAKTRFTEPRLGIEHVFRTPEKRPPSVVTAVFIVLSVAPLAVMVVLWSKLQVNISNLSLTPATIGFHGGLASIFLLYYAFWTCLNMFQTLQLLVIVGLITFVAGHRMLASMMSEKTKSQ